jgi:hypothetical protein
MATPRQRRFLRAAVAWPLVTALALATVGALSAGVWLTVSLLGLVVLVQVTAPVAVSPPWRARLRWPLWLGALAFVALAALEVQSGALDLLELFG